MDLRVEERDALERERDFEPFRDGEDARDAMSPTLDGRTRCAMFPRHEPQNIADGGQAR